MPYIYVDADDVLEEISTSELQKELIRRASGSSAYESEEDLRDMAEQLDTDRDPGIVYRAKVAQVLRIIAAGGSDSLLPKSKADQAYALWQKQARIERGTSH